jgi:hypothetical protein
LLSLLFLRGIVLNAVMLSVIVLSVVAPLLQYFLSVS